MAEITKKNHFPKNSQIIPEEAISIKKFPRIYRFITGRRYILCTILVLGVGIVLIVKDLSFVLSEERQLSQKRQQIQVHISQWQQFIMRHPGYRDGYFILSTLTYQIGDNAMAAKYIEEALQIDPNFKQAQTLQKLLLIKQIGER